MMSAFLTGLACLGIVAASSGAFIAPAIQKAETSSTSPIDVTTSNVTEDLCVLYHNKYPTNTLSYLVPHKSSGDKYEDFKFLTMYAYQGDLYIYFYSGFPRIFDDAKMVYSVSTTMAEDKTGMVENWQKENNAFVCTIHDHWGTDRVFYKAVAKNFYAYNKGDKHRAAVSSLYLTGTNLTVERSCEGAEYSWEDQAAGEEQVYSYYKDNYVVIDGAKGLIQLVPTEYTHVRQTEANEAVEMQWLFFSYSSSSRGANFDLGKLVSASLQYEYLTYDALYTVDRANWTWSHYRTIYGGLYDQPDTFLKDLGHNARDCSFTKVSSDILYSTVTPNSRSIDATTSHKTWFFFWNETHEIHYKYNTLQALDDTSVEAVPDTDFQAFLNRYKAGYKYALNFKEDKRVVSKREDFHDNFVDWYQDSQKVTTRCHEAHAIQLLKLTFNTQDGVADFNALMNPPVDVDEIITTLPKDYKTVDFSGTKVVQGIKGWFIGITVAVTAIVLIYIILITIKFAKLSNFNVNYKGVGVGAGFDSASHRNYQQPQQSSYSSPQPQESSHEDSYHSGSYHSDYHPSDSYHKGSSYPSKSDGWKNHRQ